jgi:O-acetyl-ADP-ribose deacetylase (regulator of RNase III)
MKRATQIAVGAVTKFLNENDEIEKVIFVVFNDSAYSCYEEKLI